MSPEETYLTPMFWLNLAQVLSTLILGIYVFVSNRNRATAQEIRDNYEKIENVDKSHSEHKQKLSERIAKIEGGLNHLPTGRQFTELSKSVAETRGSVEAVNQRMMALENLMGGVSATVSQLLENELAESRQNKVKG